MPTIPVASGAAKLTAYRAWPSSSRLMVGITVVTADDSNAARKMSEKVPSEVSTKSRLRRVRRSTASRGCVTRSPYEFKAT